MGNALAAAMICDCCKTREAIGVAALPYIPMSIAWCEECLRAGVIPFWAAVSNTAMIGGLQHANAGWRDLVERTLKYHGKSQEEFDHAVAESIAELEE